MCWTHPTQYWERVTTSFIIIILFLFSRATCEKSNILGEPPSMTVRHNFAMVMPVKF